MTNDFPLANVYRLPYEFASAAVAILAAFAVLRAPEWFFLSPSLGFFSACGLVLLAAARLTQGQAIRRYWSHLRRLPRYEIGAEEIPASRDELFIGRGFRWTAAHTQRRHLVVFREKERPGLLGPGPLTRWTREFERRHPAHWLADLTRRVSPLNPVAPLPPVGGDPTLHGVEPDEQDVWAPLADLFGHMIVVGTTRVGKTRLAEVLIAQDIRRGDVVIVFDPKGDKDLLLRVYAEAVRAGREKDFFLFHLGFPGISARYNPIGNFERITEIATRISRPLPDEGNSRAFKEFVWRFVNVIARALDAVGEKPEYRRIYQYAANIDGLAKKYLSWLLDRRQPDWQRAADAVELDKGQREKASRNGRDEETLRIAAVYKEAALVDPIADALLAVLANDRTYFEKLVSSLYPLLEKLTTGEMASTIAPDYFDVDDARPILDWHSAISRRAIVYVGLDALTDQEVSGAVGSAMFADLTSSMGSIYKHGPGYGQSAPVGPRRICLHADEFNELVGPEFIPLANKGGGAGLQLRVYTQTFQDIEVRVGDEARAEQTSGNLGSMVMLRVMNERTAEMLTKRLEEVPVTTITTLSGVADANDPREFGDFSSRNEDRVTTEMMPMLSEANLVKLPKGQAFALLNGNVLHKLRLPLLLPEQNLAIPRGWEDMLDHMERKYAEYVRHAESAPLVDRLVTEGRGGGF